MREKHDKLGHNNDMVSASLQLTTKTMLLLLLFMIHVASVAEGATPLAKPGCQQKCGIIDIAYPFGIGNSSCYLDEWFEVTCRISNTSSGGGSTSKPFLKKLNLELLQVRIPKYTKETNGYIFVQNPVMASSSNCIRTTTTEVDLTGSPFYFSFKFNKFGAAGCNSQAFMTDGSGKQMNSYGCYPSCRSASVGDCCRVGIPTSLQLFKASITSSISDDDGSSCKYAFLADIDWFRDHPSTACFTDITDLDSVPAWIDFGLKLSDPLAVTLEQAKTKKGAAYGCTDYEYSDKTKIRFCFCKKGYDGNPYIENGCRDIDECLKLPEGCRGCKNTIGGYTCRSTSRIVIEVVCSIVGVLLLILAIWGGSKIVKSIQRKIYFKRNGGLLVTKNEGNANKTTLYKLEEMKKATNNFSKKNKLGAGGQGTVFKGTLSSGTQVAVKECKMDVQTPKDKKSKKSTPKGAVDKSLEAGDRDRRDEENDHEMSAFITEIVLLSETIHKNIVRLWGCCLEAKNPLLVYEHLVNGDLSSHLQHSQDPGSDAAELFVLSWDMRLKIATEIAGALSYLHFSARFPIFHRDIKTENILLDHKFTAKIADFGISKSVTGNQPPLVVNTQVKGSRGYMAPEYMETGQYTGKSDVYSFGVVLVELLTGRKPIFTYTAPGAREPTSVVLANHFKAMKMEQILSTFLDARVKRQGQPKEIADVVNLAKQCLNSEGSLRPTMKDVAMELERISASHNTAYTAEEIDQHDYESVENPAISPIEGQQATMPLRGKGSELSDGFRAGAD
ncbi:hypothetical protein OROMI_022564 [Orobanche minor]